MTNDNIQHGIDDNPSNDAEKGAALGGLGGAAVGAAAGSLAGPVGTIIGAVAGGLIGAGASGAAVAAVDAVDNDNTVSGIGDGATDDLSRDVNTTSPGYNENIRDSSGNPVVGTTVGGHNVVTGGPATSEAGNTGLAAGAVAGGLIGTAVGGPIGAVVGGALGSLAGGVAGDAAEATDDNASLAADTNYSGSAFQADALTSPDVTPIPAGYTRANNDVLSTSTQTDYRNVDAGVTSIGATDQNADVAPLGGISSPGTTPGVSFGDDVSSAQTGGLATGGSDTRGAVNSGDSDTRGVLNDGTDIGTDAADVNTLGVNSSTHGQNRNDDGGGVVR